MREARHDTKRNKARPLFWRRAARTLAGTGAALAGVAFVANWTGFGWVSGPAAIGALGALLLAFAPFPNMPAATEGDEGSYVPNLHGNTDSE